MQPGARNASMIAASQYESWKRWRASRAAIMIPLVMCWIGKRPNDWMSRTACQWLMASGRLALQRLEPGELVHREPRVRGSVG